MLHSKYCSHIVAISFPIRMIFHYFNFGFSLHIALYKDLDLRGKRCNSYFKRFNCQMDFLKNTGFLWKKVPPLGPKKPMDPCLDPTTIASPYSKVRPHFQHPPCGTTPSRACDRCCACSEYQKKKNVKKK